MKPPINNDVTSILRFLPFGEPSPLPLRGDFIYGLIFKSFKELTKYALHIFNLSSIQGLFENASMFFPNKSLTRPNATAKR